MRAARVFETFRKAAVRTSSRTRLLAACSAVAAAVAAGCASGMLPLTVVDDAVTRRWPGTTDEELTRGRLRYRDQCSGCHSLHAPGEYSPAQWDTLLPDMQRKAKTADTDRPAMFKYVMIHAKKTTDIPHQP